MKNEPVTQTRSSGPTSRRTIRHADAASAATVTRAKPRGLGEAGQLLDGDARGLVR